MYKDTEPIIKIDQNYLKNIVNTNQSALQYFGTWINDCEYLRSQFINASPIEHIVIDNFLEETYAEKIYNLFPNVNSNWYEYKNPIEVKYTFVRI